MLKVASQIAKVQTMSVVALFRDGVLGIYNYPCCKVSLNPGYSAVTSASALFLDSLICKGV